MKSSLLHGARYEIGNHAYHLPSVRHTFAHQSLRYSLIKHLNTADMVNGIFFKTIKK